MTPPINALKSEIFRLAAGKAEKIRKIRHHLHRHPELSKEEEKTAAYICARLHEYGIPYQEKINGHGVVGLIRGNGAGNRCIALRADMDALPIHEENHVAYRSRFNGKMHACGHDVHMASLLGAASILREVSDSWGGTVKLIFQPSEETYPGGALGMIEAGVLRDPDVGMVIGQHVLPTLDAGYVGFTPGRAMASTDEIFLTVRGRGGHAAQPDHVIDPVIISAHILVALQHIVSREASPLMPTVLSFGKIAGEGRTNVIPDEVKIEGTLRTYDETWRKEIHKRIEKLAASVAEGMGGNCEVRIASGYPFLHKDESLTAELMNLASGYLGAGQVVRLEERMTAEDFSYFANEVPACLYRLGTRNVEKGITSGLPSSTFVVDEKALVSGTGLLAWFAVNILNRKDQEEWEE